MWLCTMAQMFNNCMYKYPTYKSSWSSGTNKIVSDRRSWRVPRQFRPYRAGARWCGLRPALSISGGVVYDFTSGSFAPLGRWLPAARRAADGPPCRSARPAIPRCGGETPRHIAAEPACLPHNELRRLSCSRPLGRRGIDYSQSSKISPEKTPIACEQSVRRDHGVRADHKISSNPDARTSTCPVPTPSLRRFKRRFLQHGRKRNRQLLHRILKPLRVSKHGGGLRPDHFRSDQRPFAQTAPQCLSRSRRESWIRTEHIEEDIGINGGDQRRPRSCAIMASVWIFFPKQPYTSPTGSAPPSFVATRRPCSSLNSRIVPGFMPSLSRSGFGMVT